MKSKKTFLKIYKDLHTKGKLISPRGKLVKEIENYTYVLPPFVRFANFTSRKLNVNYLKKEFQWYLKGDKFDDSIIKHASMWKSVMNPDGSFNSNYGQYFFGKEQQFDVITNILKEDKDSRRASILLLTKEHLSSKTDVPCTYSLNFRIRNDMLNMSVHMRSQDVIFGMGNDAPIFSFIHEMLLNSLREFYPNLKYGTYHHIADSFHVYSNHFEMLESMLSDSYVEVNCPKISGPEEVKFLRELKFDNIPESYLFTKWIANK